ncbi:MAG: LysM peptidoglycan-binding domain-containing protein [Anaerolineales bacterium]|nr:LysM peptidoglycan-binding domain-containing protein [Anaerolineales bacterium]
MSKKQRGMLAVFIFLISTMLISACTQSLSSAPVATPTLLPDGLFVSPFPSVENPMAMIEEFAKQTAAAQTTVAGGGTPGTPQAITTGTVITPQDGVIPTATPTTTAIVISTPTNASGGQPAATSMPAGVRPNEYVLKVGEYPFCIARRFNVDPDALLRASGLTSPDIYYPGLKLVIPQSGTFPGDPSLATHPTTYTVVSSTETLGSVACKFGNVFPEDIATKNNISASASLTAGQQLQIP